MTTGDISSIRSRLETAVADLPGIPANAKEVYEAYEQIAVAILDSEHEDFIPGLLEEYLETLLYERRLVLGLAAFADLQSQ
jgi:hypothetical protein